MTRPKEEKPRVLALLRHTKSSWRDSELGDRDRPLNARGHQAGRLLAVHFAHQAPPDLVLCSSALRARETFAHIAQAYSAAPPVLIEEGLYLADARAIMQRIEAVPDRVSTLLVIGHNPGLHELASMLAQHGKRRDRDRFATKFPTGALVNFRIAGRWRDIAHAPRALTSYVTPRDLGDAAETDD